MGAHTPRAVGVALAALAAAVPMAAAQTGFTSSLRFGFTSLPVELNVGQLGSILGTDASSPFGLLPSGTVTRSDFTSSGVSIGTSDPLLFSPAPFDPLGPGATFELSVDTLTDTVAGTLTLTDADGDTIVGNFMGALALGSGNLTLIDAMFVDFAFTASGDGTNDDTFDGPDGNFFSASDLIAIDEEFVGTLQITTNLFDPTRGFSLIQGTFFAVPTPATATLALAGLAIAARRRRG